LTGPVAALRAATFVVVALAASIGVILRVASGGPRGSWFPGVESLNFSPGQPLGSATFDGIADKGVRTVRLEAKQCGKPIYAAPLRLRAVAEVEVADRAYLGRPGYGVTNVYEGQVRQSFSHLARALARNPLTPGASDYYIRFYAPSDCAIDDRDYVEWAGKILGG
jgi:hypothetical protein